MVFTTLGIFELLELLNIEHLVITIPRGYFQMFIQSTYALLKTDMPTFVLLNN